MPLTSAKTLSELLQLSILKYSSADFLAVLTEIRYSAGDRIHEFEILRNPFGPTAKVPLVYHNKSQRFYELSEKDDE